jgi:hypothetical protein
MFISWNLSGMAGETYLPDWSVFLHLFAAFGFVNNLTILQLSLSEILMHMIAIFCLLEQHGGASCK